MCPCCAAGCSAFRRAARPRSPRPNYRRRKRKSPELARPFFRINLPVFAPAILEMLRLPLVRRGDSGQPRSPAGLHARAGRSTRSVSSRCQACRTLPAPTPLSSLCLASIHPHRGRLTFGSSFGYRPADRTSPAGFLLIRPALPGGALKDDRCLSVESRPESTGIPKKAAYPWTPDRSSPGHRVGRSGSSKPREALARMQAGESNGCAERGHPGDYGGSAKPERSTHRAKRRLAIDRVR